MLDESKKKLQEPFGIEDIEWRPQSTGKSGDRVWAIVLAYVTNRAIQDRLDNVFGIDSWQNVFEPSPEGGILCGIKVKIGDEWITKYDGAEKTNIEPTKGGLSGAMKRAAVQWGIGRYLYRLPTTIVNAQTTKPDHGDYLTAFVKINGQGQRIYYKTPTLPEWATPKADG